MDGIAKHPLAMNGKDPTLLRGDPITPERYYCRDFMQREWDRLWTKVWHIAGRRQPSQTDWRHHRSRLHARIRHHREAGRWLAQGVPQRLRPPRPAAGLGRWRPQLLPLPLPRLAVGHGRRAAGLPGPGRLSPGRPGGQAEAGGGARRHLGRPRLVHHGRRSTAADGLSGPAAGNLPQLPVREDRARPLDARRARLQLEILVGQLQRVLPHPHRSPPGAAGHRPRPLHLALRNVPHGSCAHHPNGPPLAARPGAGRRAPSVGQRTAALGPRPEPLPGLRNQGDAGLARPQGGQAQAVEEDGLPALRTSDR